AVSTCWRAGSHSEAIGRFERPLHRTADDPRVLFALGNTARVLGMPRPAEDFYRRVLALDPDRIEALVNLANLLRAAGQFETALALLAPAVARSPESPELWLTLGSVHRENGQKGEAQDCYQRALDLDVD